MINQQKLTIHPACGGHRAPSLDFVGFSCPGMPEAAIRLKFGRYVVRGE
jgi:hypothetical protein